MLNLSSTLISNKAIKSHTYLDFALILLKRKGKYIKYSKNVMEKIQHYKFQDFHTKNKLIFKF